MLRARFRWLQLGSGAHGLTYKGENVSHDCVAMILGGIKLKSQCCRAYHAKAQWTKGTAIDSLAGNPLNALLASDFHI